MAKSYIVKTLGCKANFYDSSRIELDLQKAGFVPLDESCVTGADLCIINSCTVTDEADRQSRRLASKLFRENPSAKVVITGCAAEVDPERLKGAAGIHYIVGNQNKNKLVELVLNQDVNANCTENSETNHTKNDSGNQTKINLTSATILGSVQSYSDLKSSHEIDREWTASEDLFGLPTEAGAMFQTSRTRVFLKIQEGCNSFCTYCIIPYGRGPSRSLDADEVIRQVTECVQLGTEEIVLTGTNLGDYGTDFKEADPTCKTGIEFEKLLSRILKETKLKRIRLSSLDPTEIPSSLIRLVKESGGRICPHFHISLQSPHSKVLKLMKRKYSTDEVIRCLNEIKTELPKAFVGMDLITGFPGETDQVFQESMGILEGLPFTRLHVFPYSERNGTPATRLKEIVPVSVRKERVKKWMSLSEHRLLKFYEENTPKSKEAIDSVMSDVMWESEHFDKQQDQVVKAGYTGNYLRIVRPQESKAISNDVVFRVHWNANSGDATLRC